MVYLFAQQKEKGKKDTKGGDNADDDDDDKETASHEGSESDGEDSPGETEEIVEVAIPTQSLYSLDAIEDDHPADRVRTVDQRAPASKGTDSPPLANGDTSPVLNHHSPLPNDAASNGPSASTQPNRQRNQHPGKAQFVQKAEGNRQATANGHPGWHGSASMGKRAELSHPQSKRSFNYSQQTRDSSSGNTETHTSQRNLRSRPVQSFATNRLHHLPPRFQRQAQEQMQSSTQQQVGEGVVVLVL